MFPDASIAKIPDKSVKVGTSPIDSHLECDDCWIATEKHTHTHTRWKVERETDFDPSESKGDGPKKSKEAEFNLGKLHKEYL